MTAKRPGAPRAARRPVSSARTAPSGSRRPSNDRRSGTERRSTERRLAGSDSRPAAERAPHRRPAPAARARTNAPATAEEPAALSITWQSLFLLGLIVVCLAALVPTINIYVAQRQELSALEQRVADQEREVEELERLVARWEDPAFVAAQARERLLFAMPGETQYRVTDTSGDNVALSEAETSAEDAVEQEWFTTLWGSVEGASRATPDESDPEDTSK